MVIDGSCSASEGFNEAGKFRCYAVPQCKFIRGAVIYKDLVELHSSQQELVYDFHEQLSRKRELPECKWKVISRHKWNHIKHINILKGNHLLPEYVGCHVKSRNFLPESQR